MKSKDLVSWEHLPIALAPSEEYDKDGCFSGSAIEKDGKIFLMYTGNVWAGEDHEQDLKQVQCLAVSEDGVVFEKIKNNPVIEEAPEGNIHPFHFRDPKVWEYEGMYYCVLGSRTKEHVGQAILYRSINLIDWEYVNIVATGEGNFGYMWECPDIFRLDDQDVLLMSPQGMKPEENRYHNLHQSGYVLGKLNDEMGTLEHGSFEMIDYGFDVYAPQTTVDHKGRRIMIAWMAMWESPMPEKKYQWAGAMTLPRELILVNGRIRCTPISELESYRTNEISFQQVVVQDKKTFAGICGRSIELDVLIDCGKALSFGINLLANEDGTEKTTLSYQCDSGMVVLDRNHSGEGPRGIRKAPVLLEDRNLHLRIFIDHSSVEVFIQGGDKVMTARVYPSERSNGIQFFADGGEIEIVSLKKWDIKI